MLHDFRSSAIAAASFSKKVRAKLQQILFPSESEKIARWLNIIWKETSRIQDLALTLCGEGKDEIIDLTALIRHEEGGKTWKQST